MLHIIENDGGYKIVMTLNGKDTAVSPWYETRKMAERELKKLQEKRKQK